VDVHPSHEAPRTWRAHHRGDASLNQKRHWVPCKLNGSQAAADAKAEYSATAGAARTRFGGREVRQSVVASAPQSMRKHLRA
jgi:hypothetical protein